MNLSLRHMRAFSALVATRNFTRAAEQCHLTQSAFSALIANLESDFGLKLFSRNTRNVELTAEGEVFRNIVGHLLPETERALAEMRDQAALRKGRVAMAALPTIYSAILPNLIARFLDDYPGIELVIEDAANASCVRLVRERRVDFALCASASVGQDLVMETLASDNFHFVCRKDHPLAERKKLTAADVQYRFPIILYEKASSIRQHLDAAIYPQQWQRAFQVNSLSTAAGLIVAGLGATIVPTLGLPQFAHPDLRIIPISLPLDRRDICLLRLKDSAPSLATAAFIDMLRESIAHEVDRIRPAGRQSPSA